MMAMDFKSLRIVAVDLWRRHFLVCDAAFRKIGSADLRHGVWSFTLSSTGENFFGFSRDDAINSYFRSIA